MPSLPLSCSCPRALHSDCRWLLAETTLLLHKTQSPSARNEPVTYSCWKKTEWGLLHHNMLHFLFSFPSLFPSRKLQATFTLIFSAFQDSYNSNMSRGSYCHLVQARQVQVSPTVTCHPCILLPFYLTTWPCRDANTALCSCWPEGCWMLLCTAGCLNRELGLSKMLAKAYTLHRAGQVS